MARNSALAPADDNYGSGTSLQLMDGSDEAQAREKAWNRIQDAIKPILLTLSEEASTRVRRRSTLEERWLEDLRQYHGVYEDKVANVLKNDSERSSVFINITRPKTNAWRARLGDMLFPNDERNWGIDPTPVPTLTQDAREAAKQAEALEQQAGAAVDQHNQAVAAGQPGDPQALAQGQEAASKAIDLRSREKSAQKELEEARRRCQAMQREIDDALTEARYPAKCRDIIDDMCKVGVGIIKGPCVAGQGKQLWDVDGQTGEAFLTTDDSTLPTYRRVNFWHFFPDPDADCLDEGQGTFERHLPNRKMLRRMAKELDFDPRAVRQLLKDGAPGQSASSSDMPWLAQLKNMDDGSADVVNGLKDRWVVWEFHGSLEVEEIADMIRAMGRFDDAQRFEDEADTLDERMVKVYFCGDVLLKIEEDYLLDSGASLYSVSTFEKAEASILGGVGVPRLMRHEQAMLNSAVRMMLDNAALATGPQLVVDKGAVEPENGSWKFTPRKVWQKVKTAAMSEKDGRPFETFDIPMNEQHLASIVQLALRFVDESVAMPLIAQGEQGAHVTRTASGMSMLFNSANVVFRRVVKNWDDDLTAPVIRRTYDFFMQFSAKPEIKGDMKVEARGTAVLLVREMQVEQLAGILREWSLHPVLGVGFKAYNSMKLMLQAMNINPDDVLVSEEEYQQKLKQMAQQKQAEGGGGNPGEELRAKTQVEVAKIDADSRKLTAESNERVAQMRVEAEFAKLAQAKEVSLETVRAMFEGKKLDVHGKIITAKLKEDGAERRLAAEIGVEKQNAMEARAEGMEPTGSGGAVSMGVAK